MTSPLAGSDFSPGQALAGRPSSVLRHEQLDSDPCQLRASLAELDGLLKGCEPGLRRRVRLVFGELVARWHEGFSGEAIATMIELLPGAVRVRYSNAEQALTPKDWEDLVSAPIGDLVDAWGIDRRAKGSAWFEFRPDRTTERDIPAPRE